MDPSGPRSARPVPNTERAVVDDTQLRFIPKLSTTKE
jgi:hypothetical protein